MKHINNLKNTFFSRIGKLTTILTLTLVTLQLKLNAYAFEIPDGSRRFEFPKIDELIGSFILTIQYFSAGIAILVVAYTGFKVMTSSDSTRAMEEVKSDLGKVFMGAVITFLAVTIVKIITDALGFTA